MSKKEPFNVKFPEEKTFQKKNWFKKTLYFLEFFLILNVDVKKCRK